MAGTLTVVLAVGANAATVQESVTVVDPLADYVSFRATVDTFYADLGDIPPDNFTGDATARVGAFLAVLEGINPDECYAERFVTEEYAATAILAWLTAPPEYDAYGSAALGLGTTLHEYAAGLAVTC